MEPNYNEMLDATRRKLAESGYQETGSGLISPAPAERVDVTETLTEEELGVLDYAPVTPPAGAELLPLNVTETRFLEFWRSVPAWNIEEAGAEFQRMLNREADLAAQPFVGRVSFRFTDGTERHLRSFAASDRDIAYSHAKAFIQNQDAKNRAFCIITIEPRT